MKVLFFDDDKTNLSNVLLAKRILYEIPNIILKQPHSFQIFEKRMQEGGFDVIILDIMGAQSNITSLEGKGKVMGNTIGIEMLKRIRASVYSNQKHDVLIIMRSARARQSRIREICDEHGSDHFFAPGNDDDQIIEILKEKMKTMCT